MGLLLTIGIKYPEILVLLEFSVYYNFQITSYDTMVTRKPATTQHTYGFYRIEILAAPKIVQYNF